MAVKPVNFQRNGSEYSHHENVRRYPTRFPQEGAITLKYRDGWGFGEFFDKLAAVPILFREVSGGFMSQDLSDRNVTEILKRAGAGERSVTDQLLPLVYDELRRLANHLLAGAKANSTLQPTAVVHEAYLKLVSGATPSWESRAHFFAVAAKAMRQILADQARSRSAAKRGGDRDRVTLTGLLTPSVESEFDLEGLHAALEKLTELDPQQARVVECRFLVGMSVEEIAHVLGISTRSVERDWAAAKLWLRRELS